MTEPIIVESPPTPVLESHMSYSIPWPTIIISILGAITVIYTAIAPGVNQHRRFFGALFLALWTIMWGIILWVIWKDYHQSRSWWLLLFSVIIMAFFFIFIIVMNLGT